MRRLLFMVLLLSGLLSNAQTDSLRGKINRIAKNIKADVGVSVLALESNDTLTIHGSSHYPMQSLYKFHLALHVLHEVDKGKLKLDQKIFIKKSDLTPSTYSPMRDDHPGGNFDITLRELIKYTVSKSDNIACDKLFGLTGGAVAVDKYLHELGVRDVSIAATEEEMHKEWNVQFTNWTTPTAATLVAKKFYSNNILSKPSFSLLYEVMLETSTGPNRIKGLLPCGTPVAHKTGTSGTDDQGILAVVDDLGIITLPNGKHVAIVVMVCNTTEPLQACEKTIAGISLEVYNHFAKQSDTETPR